MENNIVREPENHTSVLTMEYVLEQIDKIMKDIAYVREAIDSVNNVEGIAAEAIAGIVHAREKTNQQLIQLLEKMLSLIHIFIPGHHHADFQSYETGKAFV